MRSGKASSTIELVGMIMLMVPIALLALDLAFVAFVGFYSDAACREAARAASQQTTEDAAKGAASFALQNYQVIGGGLVGNPVISNFHFSFSYAPADPHNPKDSPLPLEIPALSSGSVPALSACGGTAPNVQVETTMLCGVPAPVLIGPGGLTNQITLRSSFTFPLVNGVTDPNDSTGDTGVDPSGPQDPNS